jgi:hypothetical protein
LILLKNSWKANDTIQINSNNIPLTERDPEEGNHSQAEMKIVHLHHFQKIERTNEDRRLYIFLKMMKMLQDFVAISENLAKYRSMLPQYSPNVQHSSDCFQEEKSVVVGTRSFLAQNTYTPTNRRSTHHGQPTKFPHINQQNILVRRVRSFSKIWWILKILKKKIMEELLKKWKGITQVSLTNDMLESFHNICHNTKRNRVENDLLFVSRKKSRNPENNDNENGDENEDPYETSFSDHEILDHKDECSKEQDHREDEDEQQGERNDNQNYEDEVEEQQYINQEYDQDDNTNFHDYSQCQWGKQYKYIYHNSDRNHGGDIKLSPESKWTIDDLCLAILTLRQQDPHSLGNEIGGGVFGLIAMILPNTYEFFRELSTATSSYQTNQMLFNVLHKKNNVLPAIICHKCPCGFHTYTGDRVICPKCQISKNVKSEVFYFLPFKPRLRKLLESKLLPKIFDFNEYRSKDPNIISDVYDGSIWQLFESRMEINERLIGVELSWDGTNPFIHGTKSIWPVFCSILNFPSNVRGIMHSGMHMIALDTGDQAVWDPIVEEFNDLWLNGITLNGVKNRVAILRVTLDGRAFESLTRTSGMSSNPSVLIDYLL